MSTQPLRLVKQNSSGTPGNPGDEDPFVLERRRASRHPVAGKVTAVCKEHTADGLHNRICALQMINMSDTGLGAIVQEEITLDTTVAVFFPAHGNEKGFDLVGKVVRCRRREDGHELGLRFDRMAAA